MSLLQLYSTPKDATVKPDKWWGKKYRLENDEFTPYTVYRDKIDELILAQLPPLLSPGCRVAELCGGDGSLAEKLLAAFPEVSHYSLLERNAALVKSAKQRLPTETATVHKVDTTTAAGAELIEGLKPDVWIASGSVLCGQVGSAGMAEPTLQRMADSLRAGGGGVMVITGYTTTFFTPAMLVSAGATVRAGSLPSDAAEGLCTDSGRFHMWILDVAAAREEECDKGLKGEEKEALPEGTAGPKEETAIRERCEDLAN
jgi:hypothetical protein